MELVSEMNLSFVLMCFVDSYLTMIVYSPVYARHCEMVSAEFVFDLSKRVSSPLPFFLHRIISLFLLQHQSPNSNPHSNSTTFWFLSGTNIHLFGGGTIDGNGQVWWDTFNRTHVSIVFSLFLVSLRPKRFSLVFVEFLNRND